MKRNHKKPDVLRNNLFLLREIHKASPGRIALGLTVIFLKSASNFLFDVYMLRYIVNGLQVGRSFHEIALFVLCIAAYHWGVCILENWFYTAYAPVSDQKIARYLQRKVFTKAVAVDLACFEDPGFYDKYVKAAGEASQRTGQVLGTLNRIVQYVFTLAAMSFLIFTIDPVLIVFAIIPFVVSSIFGKRLNKVHYDYQMEMKEGIRKRDYSRRLFYLQDYAKELRMSNVNKVILSRFYQTIRDLKGLVKKYGLKTALLDYVLQTTNDVVVYLGAILYAAWKTVVRKTMLLGDCVVVVNTINSVAASLRGVVDLYLQFQKHALYIEDLKRFLDAPAELSAEGGKEISEPFETLSFRDVAFSYPGQSGAALRGIDFTLNAGEKVAVVGLNGAGKTTFVKLMLRLYDPSSGEILYNGHPLRAWDPAAYRKIFSTVFQDYKLYAFSVLDNLLLRDGTAEDRNRAERLLKAFGLYDKIAASPMGIDNEMTREFRKDGLVLSTGEQQKLAIIRALMNPAQILVMDEPSSAIDPISESRIFETVLRESGDRTVLFISHRLSATQYADKIYVFDGGVIRETGTHGELLKQNGIYADLWNKQAENYRKLEETQ